MARKKAWGPSNALWRWQHRQSSSPQRAKRVNTMARRGYRRYGRRRGSGGFGLGRLLSPKNLMFTAGAVLLLPRFVNVDPKIAGAAGGFLGAGPIGAVAGYLAAPFVSGMTGGSGASSNGGF